MRRAGLVTNPEWGEVERQLKIVEKRYVADRGDFVSFAVVGGVCYKNPIILYRRLIGHLTRGKGNEIALGYFEMFANNYSLGENLLSVMTPEEIEHQSAVNRIMFNLRKFGVTTHVPWQDLQVGIDEMEIQTLDVFQTVSQIEITEGALESFTQASGDFIHGFRDISSFGDFGGSS